MVVVLLLVLLVMRRSRATDIKCVFVFLLLTMPEPAEKGRKGGGGREGGRASTSAPNDRRAMSSINTLTCHLGGRTSPATQSAASPLIFSTIRASLLTQPPCPPNSPSSSSFPAAAALPALPPPRRRARARRRKWRGWVVSAPTKTSKVAWTSSSILVF